ncbi:hypothetical protein T484DRAFT_1868781 [Baffinella frigidus]|nr:hypothetical protein T484DRAFT_1868781 [Cryptophyta sp. CCMP2293]
MWPASGRLTGTPVASLRYDEALEQPEPKPDPPSFFDKTAEAMEHLIGEIIQF